MNSLALVSLAFAFPFFGTRAAPAPRQLVIPASNIVIEAVSGADRSVVRQNLVTMKVDGADVPALELDFPWTEKGGVHLKLVFNPPIDMMHDWPTVKYAYSNAQTGRFQGYFRQGSNGTMNEVIGDGIDWAVVTRSGGPGVFVRDRDLGHFPSGNSFMDVRQVTGFTLDIPMDSWSNRAARQTFRMTGFTFTATNSWSVKHQADWERWVKFTDNYQPDYSDSSKYLEPPATGRIKKPLPLVINGRPNAEIVITPDAFGVVSNAAKELRYWVRTISGAELPIVTNEGPAAVKILLNSPEGADKFAADVEWLKKGAGDDGYFVRTVGNRVYIGCAYTSAESRNPPPGTPMKDWRTPPVPAGVLRGVDRFIENNFGLIFAYCPRSWSYDREVDESEFGTVYDETNNLSVVWGDAADRPKTKYRQSEGDVRWLVRNGDNSYVPDSWGGNGLVKGEFIEYLPNTNAYQIFADGKRVPFSYYGTQICLGAPDALELSVKHAVDTVKQHRARGERITSIGWYNEDNWHVCTCPACTAPIKCFDGTVLTSNGRSTYHWMAAPERTYRSTQFYAFANKLADGLKAECPDVQVETLAYFFMEPPPKLEKLSPNLSWLYAPLYVRGAYHVPTYAPQNHTTYQHWTELARLGGHMHVYEYYYTIAAEVMKEDIRSYVEGGCELMFSEMTSPEPMTIENQWCYLRLCWDYDQDVEQLRKYFIRRVYHEGAPLIERYGGTRREPWFHTGAKVDVMQDGDFLRQAQEVLPRIRNFKARVNFWKFMRVVGRQYVAQQVREKKMTQAEADALWPQEPDDTKLSPMVRALLGRDGNVKRWFPGYHPTILEQNGKFVETLRLTFTPDSRGWQECWFDDAFGKTALQGSLRFKIRMRAPAVATSVDDLPRVAFCDEKVTRRTDSFLDNNQCYRPLGGGMWEFTGRPIAKVDANDLVRFYMTFDGSPIAPAAGPRVFEIFDPEIVK